MAYEKLEQHKEQFLLFVETGFIAVNQSDEESATRLFKAAAMLNADSPLPTIGMGYLHLCKLELKQAVEKFEQVLNKDPENEMARSMLGITLTLTPNLVNEGEKILHSLASKSKEKEVKNLANTSLDFVEKFVKKPMSPSDLQSQKKKDR